MARDSPRWIRTERAKDVSSANLTSKAPLAVSAGAPFNGHRAAGREVERSGAGRAVGDSDAVEFVGCPARGPLGAAAGRTVKYISPACDDCTSIPSRARSNRRSGNRSRTGRIPTSGFPGRWPQPTRESVRKMEPTRFQPVAKRDRISLIAVPVDLVRSG